MHARTWQVDGERRCARLQLGQLTATIDLGQPHKGLVDVHLGADRLAGGQLLGIAAASFPLSEETSWDETHTRGSDLVATCKGSAGRRVQIDALWRAVSPKPSESFIAAVELVVSVQTHLPESRPELAVRSKLSATETLRLVDAGPAGYRPVAASPGAPAVMQPGDGTGCLLLRLPGVELSYAEMAHPADFQHDELTGGAEGDGTTSVSHRLFFGRLEKGVILRGRVRGIFLPRERDTQIAAECYTAFADAKPPLGT